MRWYFAPVVLLALADATGASGPPPAGWTKRVERGVAILSVRSNEAVRDGLGLSKGHPSLVVECGQPPSLRIESGIALLASAPLFSTEPILLRFDDEAARDVPAQVVTSNVLFGKASREVLQELLSHQRLLVRLLARQGRVETTFDLRGLAVALEAAEGGCGLPPGAAPATAPPPTAAVAPPSVRPASPASSVGRWSVKVTPNPFGRGDTVLLGTPSDWARARPGTPHAASLVVRAHEGRVEVYVLAPAILEGLENIVVRLDDEEPRTMPTSPASDSRGFFFTRPTAFLRELARHRRMAIPLKVFGVAERRDVAFDLDGLDGAAEPLLAAAGLPPAFLTGWEPGVARGAYKGFDVTAELREKDRSVGGQYAATGRFVAKGAENHMVAVRLNLVRGAGAAADWKIDDRKALLPAAEVRLFDVEGASYPAIVEDLDAAVASFDKELRKGAAWFYFEVPKGLPCRTSTVGLAGLRLRFEQDKFPKTCE